MSGVSITDKFYCLVADYIMTVKCDLDYMEPIKWNTKALEDLVLDQDHKDVLLTFCQKHDEDSRNERGLIAGKGLIPRQNCRFVF